jgi:uncharacterized membrane protein
MIQAYLRQLESSLDVPRRLRARILDEARDHLLEMVETGLSEQQAVEAFGAPDALARDFHEQLASSSAHRASAMTGVMLIALAALALVTPPWWGLTAIAFFAGQVAVVAGVLALVRSLRYRAEGAVPASALPDVYRANAVAFACVELVVLSFAIRVVIRGDASTALVVATAALGVITTATAVALLRSMARARPLAGAEPEGDAFDDLLALTPPPLEQPALRIIDWIRDHRWRFCALFAAACGLAVGVGHVVTDHGGAIDPARTALAVLVLASVEGAAVVLGYVALGGVLGIRRARA